MSERKALLYGSEKLTAEEEYLRLELMAWCQEKLDQGARPIPLQACLRIVGEDMRNPSDMGLVVGRGKTPLGSGYKGLFGPNWKQSTVVPFK